MKMNVDLDTVVGLVLEYAECHHMMIKIVKDINNRYDTGNPSDEEKIQFLRGILPLLPTNSYLTDVVKRYIATIDAGEDEEQNAVIKQVTDYLLEDGGLVTVYKVKSIMLSDFFVATFDDGDDEVPWGIGDTTEDALRSAEREWDHYNHEEGPDQNPFTLTLRQVQS